MREFTFDNGKEDKVIEAMSYKKAVKSYQSSSNLKDDGNMVNVYWLGKKGKEEGTRQKLPLGREKKLRQYMAKLAKSFVPHVSTPKKTSQGKRKNVSYSSMNKDRKRDHKPYRGQGR